MSTISVLELEKRMLIGTGVMTGVSLVGALVASPRLAIGGLSQYWLAFLALFAIYGLQGLIWYIWYSEEQLRPGKTGHTVKSVYNSSMIQAGVFAAIGLVFMFVGPYFLLNRIATMGNVLFWVHLIHLMVVVFVSQATF
jgi:hypothetical protein